MPHGTSPDMTEALVALEHSLWRAESRFDTALMAETFAPGFFEFGRSGRRYTRDDLLIDTGAPFEAQLHDLKITPLSATVALVTYVSERRGTEGTDWGNRASIWDRASGRWQLRFHQGTPTAPIGPS